MRSIVIFTDGSCNVKNRLGGYGALLQFKDGEEVLGEKEISVGYSNTTISRMELRAITESLKVIKEKDLYPVLVVSDSQYTVNSINKDWVLNWERENFFGRKNSDLWIEFLVEKRKFKKNNLIFKHTRGHDRGLECYRNGNNRADILADYKRHTVYLQDI